MSSKKISDEILLKQLEIQWNDHIQTRVQTWDALKINLILAVAIVGLDWIVGSQLSAIFSSVLLAMAALFGMQITLRHRNKVEITKLRIISSIENSLGIGDPQLTLPDRLNWWQIFVIWKSNTPLFILRLQFIVLIFSIVFLFFRLTST